ncbi:MAG: hypothetical protein J6X78_00135 [Treponema sp.]|nr:hypothetical protein [Treponema sp.]
MEKKDVILIGLGEFGEKTLKLFENIWDERIYQMPKELQDTISVHPLVFKNKFNYKEVSERISAAVAKTSTKQWNGKFSYIFIGDLYEDVTSRYGLEYSIVPVILEQHNNTILRNDDEVLGFFTFSEKLGTEINCSAEKLSDIANFFKKMEQVCKDQFYKPSFKDASGREIPEMSCPTGTFSRNYIFVTPGDQDAVNTMTSQVFAERMYYELFYLMSNCKGIVDNMQQKIGADTTAKDKCFCGFTMVQISRLSELQRYFLKYTLEDKVTDCLLGKGPVGTNSEAFREKFFEMIDVPKDGKFPADLAVDIFMRNNSSLVTKLIPKYITRQKTDINEYVQECRKNIDEKLDELRFHYNGFVESELENLILELEKGWKSLFRINRLTGNINSYINYVESVKKAFENWTSSLKEAIDGIKEVSLDKSFEDAEKKVRKLQESTLYKLPFFIPIRQLLIENVLLSLPLEQYMRTQIKKELLECFRVHLEDQSSNSRNPTGICEELISDLKLMKEKLEKKKVQIAQKKEFIKKVPSYYYIISQLEQEDYSKRLELIESKNFGPAKSSRIEAVAKDVFRNWASDNGQEKDRQSITKNPSDFINFVDSYIEKKAEEGFCEIEVGREDFNTFASEGLRLMRTRADNLSQKTFLTKDTTNYLEMQKIVVHPEQIEEDLLEIKLKDMNDIDQTVNVKKEFTLGAISYFQDYLYMDYKKLQHYNTLFKKFNKDAIKEYEVSEESVNVSEELTESEEYIRSLLLDYCEDFARAYMYRQNFPNEVSGRSDEDVLEMSKNDVNRLVKKVDINILLEGLDDDKLNNFAKDFEFPLHPDRERQIEIIKHEMGVN